jgi:hypothetical protein
MLMSAYMDTVLIRIERALDLIDGFVAQVVDINGAEVRFENPFRDTTLDGFNWAELLTILNQARTRTAELLEGKIN